MKTHYFTLILMAFYLCMCTPDSVQIQPIKVDGKRFEVDSRRVLTPKTDYYWLKENSSVMYPTPPITIYSITY